MPRLPHGSPLGVARMLWFFQLLFFASGVSGLFYEIVWSRQLATLFGVSAFALSAVLSAYFIGMAVGALFLGAVADRLRRPLAAYGMLEIATSVLAVAITLVLPQLDHLAVPWFAALEGRFLLQSLLRVALALAVLLPPTLLLGATLPVLARGVATRETVLGETIARLYAVNTAGAVCGALVAGFWLVPLLGLRATACVGGAIGIGVGACALSFGERLAPSPPPPSAEHAVRGDRVVLAAFALSGLFALALEVVLTRILIQYMNSTTRVFTAILAVFLAGIALGSALASRFSDRHASSARWWLAATEIAIGLAAAFAFPAFRFAMPAICGLLGSGTAAPGATSMTWFALLASSAAFGGPTLLLGATFPLAVRAYLGSVDAVGARLGRLYAANTAGGVLGSFAAGFALIPWLGSDRTLQLLALGFVATGALLLLGSRERLGGRRAPLWVSAVLCAALLLGRAPDAAQEYAPARISAERVLHVSEDYYGTIAVVERRDGSKLYRQLMINGDFMSGTSDYAQRYMRLSAHLPVMFAERPVRSGLVICFGAGISIDALAQHPEIDDLTVVELSPDVLASATWFAHVNRDVLHNPRVKAVQADGRNYLLTHTDKRFDLITLEPPPPPSAGAANLYSRDFYRLARERLSPGGVMAQWMPLATQQPETTVALLRAFAESFPEVAVFWTETLEALAIGSDRPLVLRVDRVREALSNPQVGADLRSIGIQDPYDVLADFLFDQHAMWDLVSSQPPVTDDHPLVEYRSAGVIQENWKMVQRLLQYREQPDQIARRFGLAEGDAAILTARMRAQRDERFVVERRTGAQASFR